MIQDLPPFVSRAWRMVMLCVCLLLVFGTAHAMVTDELIMIRSKQDFPTTMVNLQEAIKEQGYQVSRVQRVDIGLSKSGFKTDRYRLVFFGKGSEIETLRKKYPSLIPYLPLKIVIFAEGEETLLVALNPKQLMRMYREPLLQSIFSRWQQDVINIMRVVRVAD